jgi:FtsP/CotA-like multicopper oxidase with cupredoxin domain
VGAEFDHGPVDAGLGGSGGDAESPGDFVVAPPVGDEVGVGVRELKAAGACGSGSLASAPDESAVPDRLSTVEPLGPAQAAVTRTLLFQHRRNSWTINARQFDPIQLLARPRVGGTKVWRFVTDFHHPIHLHVEQFQVLSRNGDN